MFRKIFQCLLGHTTYFAGWPENTEVRYAESSRPWHTLIRKSSMFWVKSTSETENHLITNK